MPVPTAVGTPNGGLSVKSVVVVEGTTVDNGMFTELVFVVIGGIVLVIVGRVDDSGTVVDMLGCVVVGRIDVDVVVVADVSLLGC